MRKPNRLTFFFSAAWLLLRTNTNGLSLVRKEEECVNLDAVIDKNEKKDRDMSLNIILFNKTSALKSGEKSHKFVNLNEKDQQIE